MKDEKTPDNEKIEATATDNQKVATPPKDDSADSGNSQAVNIPEDTHPLNIEFPPSGEKGTVPEPRAEVKRGRGRPKGSGTRTKKSVKEESESIELAARGEAEGLVSLLDMCKQMIGGEEGLNASRELRPHVVDCATRVVIEENLHIPAKYFLIPLIVLYTTPAVQTDTGKKRLRAMFSPFARIKGWFRRG